MRYRNIYSLFRERVEQYSSQNIFYVRQNNCWVGISWDRFCEEAHQFGYSLIAMGLKPGTPVCILMGNTPEWPVGDLGTIIAGGVSVGLYPTNSSEQCKYIINHSGARFVLVDTRQQLEKILRVRQELSAIETIIVLDEAAIEGYPGLLSYREWLKIGRENREREHPVLKARAGDGRSYLVALITLNQVETEEYASLK